ncbi:MAG: TAT-variant-translocated molybdopterin oxidoreductase [Deltaproteobacteria bacterium]|nr:TAT-variant-translocated molybdopterin oxidoreductase [Deltaproteobacteria bacterium]
MTLKDHKGNGTGAPPRTLGGGNSSPLTVLPEEGRLAKEQHPLDQGPQSSPSPKGSLQESLAQEELNLAAVRDRLDGTSGKTFWRSLDELAQAEGFQDMLHREFPRQAAEWDDGVSRRSFLHLAGAGLALAGLTGCTRQPAERLVPYVRQPEEIVPGRPLFFATASTLAGYATGLLAESHMGRPTKVEGNPEHLDSLGASDVINQASTLGLYDPDRSTSVTHIGRLTTWETFVEKIQGAVRAQEALAGEGLRILTGASSSPTLESQWAEIEKRFPKAKWVQFEPVGQGERGAGAELAFGRTAEVRYDLSAAEVIFSLDADFLTQGPGHLRHARQFAAGRRTHENGGTMSRLYAVESTPTSTGTQADHRLPLSSVEIGHLVLAVAERVGVPGVSTPPSFTRPSVVAWADAVAMDLAAHRGRSLVVVGEYASAAVQAVAHGINEALGNVGSTVIYQEPVTGQSADSHGALRNLVEEMEQGKVDLLMILDTNPVFSAPADLDFVGALGKVKLGVHLGLYEDETAEYCHWHVPQAHFLEGWSDARGSDGTVSLVQPLIEPLFQGRTVHQLLAILTGQAGYSAYELVEGYWISQGLSGKAWKKALHDGYLAESALPALDVVVSNAGVAKAARELSGAESGDGLELIFRPDPSIYDGRFANSGWLQEVPKPLTKLTWDNALMISPATVERLGLAGEQKSGGFLPKQLKGEAAKAGHLLSASGRMVRLTVEGRSLEVPLWVLPGQADGVLTLHLGFGRGRAGRVGTGIGFDAYQIRTSQHPWKVSGAEIALTGATYPLSSTQLHHNIPVESQEAKKRHMVRTASLEEFMAEPDVIHHMGHAEMAERSLYPGFEYKNLAWGMTIDLSSCTGCNACVVACQAENNIPVVGKEQVGKGREMQWLRIDRYFEGDLENPKVHHQPVPCMQCEQAPCEVVCPVAATVHNEDGLNDMVYNRCVGTRYCSNNCPYKVRRFNFLKFNDTDDPLVAMGRNPDVTVRFRGVMEKCTYCVQRINQVKIDAKVQDRDIRDGEIVSACQQACPSEAIVFGDINDEASKVRRWKESPLNYALLEELGTRPRTTYLAKLTNPNPGLESPKPESERS